jgi:hypothetical protein
MIKPLTSSCLLLLALAAATPLAAMEWLSDSELEQSCDRFLEDSSSSDGVLCLAFLQGFLAGADTVEPRTVANATKSDSVGSESFSDRATRTRLGTLRMMHLQSASKADYCLDPDIPAVEVVETIATYLKDHPDSLQLTNSEAARKALIHNYPCEQ